MKRCASKRASLVASLTAPPSRQQLASLASAVEWLEVRADRMAGIEAPDWPGRLIYALRSRARGGAFAGDRAARRRRLVAAARDYDLVELEDGHDLSPALLAQIPACRRLISWHGPTAELEASWRRLAAIPARLYKLVTQAPAADAQRESVALLASLRRSDVVIFAGGEHGFWTRLVAPHLGSPMVFAPLASDEALPAIPQLIADYGLPALPPITQTFGIAGRSVLRSSSPRLHNAAYRTLGLEALYLPFPTDSFTDLWRALAVTDGLADLGMALGGLTVVAPHKEAAVEALRNGNGRRDASGRDASSRAASDRDASELVRRSGAANLLTRSAMGTWRAGSTDPQGVLDPLRQRRIPLRNRPVAVVGCGGSGRTAAAALADAGARVVLVNRSRSRGRQAAERLSLPFVPLAEFDPRGFAIVLNATPVGRDGEPPPFSAGRLGAAAVVVELVYGESPSPLIQEASDRGLVAIDGREVLLAQTRHQLHSMTGRWIDGEQLRAFLDSPG